jgi:hypothetical protein
MLIPTLCFLLSRLHHKAQKVSSRIFLQALTLLILGKAILPGDALHESFDRELEKVIRALRADEGGREKPPPARL